MRRLLAAATLAAAAAVTLAPTAASACDPNRFPNCMTYCGWVAWRYREMAEMSRYELPPWPRTGVAGCP